MSEIFDLALNDLPEDVKKDVSQNFDVIDRIRYIMSKKQFTHYDLANLLGETESEVTKWMRGTHDFTLSTLRKIEEKTGERIIFILPPEENLKKHESNIATASKYHLSIEYNYIESSDFSISRNTEKDKLVKKFVGKMEYSTN